MPRGLLALPLVALLAAPAAAAVPPAFDDAPLRAVRFVDARVGWAVGDGGAVFQTIDAGKTWERMRTGATASFRSICFLTPYTGWIAGRQELPNGGSVGVVLHTADGGLTWRELTGGTLSGLNHVRFFDDRRGVVAGDGTDAFPSGVFATDDGGKTWTQAVGQRATSWLAGEFTAPGRGLVAGAWGRVTLVRDGKLTPAELDPLAGRAVRGLAADGDRLVAVADGGRVLTSPNGGVRWGFAELPLPREALNCLDLRCVATTGGHVWAAGRPGSVVLHSADFGRTWEVQKTGHPVPLNALHMHDERTGWAVGDLGTILGTTDGGKTWAVLKCGGQRAGVLFAHARPVTTPLGAVAEVGAKDGYLAAVLGLTAADPESAEPGRAADEFRLAAAVRAAGGAAAESCWGFPVAGHAAELSADDLAAGWDKLHDGKGRDELVRRLVLAVRTWRPEVVVGDPFPLSDHPADRLALVAVQEAFKKAADPAAFPEQLSALGLEPFAPKKLYAVTADAPDAPVKLDLSAFAPELGDTLRDAVEPAAAMLPGATNPDRRAFRLLSHRLLGSDRHPGLMDGTDLAEGGTARRPKAEASPALAALLADREKAARTRRQLEAMTSGPDMLGGAAEKQLAVAAGMIAGMPDDMAARAAVGLGRQLAAAGRWTAARELFTLVAEKYPAHPEAAEALGWLARFYSSSEVRRRIELGHQAVYQKTAFVPAGDDIQQAKFVEPAITARAAFRFSGPEAATAWNRASLDLDPKLAAFGNGFARDPAVNLCLMASRRQLGRYGDAAQQAQRLVSAAGGADRGPGVDPWRDCLAAELWLGNRGAVPVRPKQYGLAAAAATRPFLDGKLDDACWQTYQPLPLADAAGATGKQYPTRAQFAHDDRFLYVAVTCGHPEGKQVPKADRRGYDADLRGRDRVDVLLDLDRDYQTAYRLSVDHRGCVADDCWGDRGWNPKWFVAVEPTPTGWTAEIAVPLAELTGTPPTPGTVWAANVVRVLPGQGVQAWSGPADNAPRLEGLGLLEFRGK